MALKADEYCADCAGFDVEWMKECPKHKGVHLCRGCQCPWCLEEEGDDDDYDIAEAEAANMAATKSYGW